MEAKSYVTGVHVCAGPPGRPTPNIFMGKKGAREPILSGMGRRKEEEEA